MRSIFIFFTVILFFSTTFHAEAQSILSKEISIAANRQPLGKVFDLMEQKENFKFAYYSKLVPRDSIISISAESATIENVLDQVLDKRYEYKETAGFVVLRYAPLELILILEKNINIGESCLITGYVIDANTSLRIPNASVYEKNVLQSTLTNKNGNFVMRIKHTPQPIELTATKENYKSVTSMFLPEVVVDEGKKSNLLDYVVGDFSNIEKSGLGRLFISSRQKLQSLNLGGVIAKAPIQFSLIPSISTHGMMNAQIVNNFSLNIIGGYSAGVRGFEIAGLYNINKMNVEALQLAGLFNTAGGNVTGVQLGGIYNNSMGNLIGIQLSGGHNSLRGTMNGIQLTSGYNKVEKDAHGVQMSDAYNSVKGTMTGIQINAGYNNIGQNLYGVQMSAGYNVIKDSLNGLQFTAGYNSVRKNARGLQVGAVNYARKIDGVQFGIVNVSDTIAGYSIGLLNFKKGGYKKLSTSTNELTNVNIAIKTGDNKLYTILSAGATAHNNEEQLFSMGVGVGKNIPLGGRISINPEFTVHYLYLDKWQDTNLLLKFDAPITYRIFKRLAIFTGPSFNMYSSEQKDISLPNAAYKFIENRTERFHLYKNKNRIGWIGWSFGITLL
ncbi:LA_2272 family surface repeat-containing protein [Flavobacterium cerinum]|uniref:Carboxypeptidase regulatory-like domain-containing protein n=1 Tax=Flavobacterium cerinum TaxID=2502784 RepID=A0A3S4T2F6_9FLAO|nr:carboxypeptidase-like regulatory domain-containing protein [Flavobacterium cerinum]RWX01555.1 carboxypeptidase regulatory-like domain-containing protein [Flavobacterium cerinum]